MTAKLLELLYCWGCAILLGMCWCGSVDANSTFAEKPNVNDLFSNDLRDVYLGEKLELLPGAGPRHLSPELKSALEEERNSWHFMPWHRTRAKVTDEMYVVKKCETPDNNFPEDLFTPEQLRRGAIILHFIAVVYAFSLLAVICDDYFLPTVECICEDLRISKDVAAATFMATATSTPELFVNVVATFLSESDLGIGTIVGSAMFNALGVATIGSLAAKKLINIKQWPVTRDCIIYFLVVSVLLILSWDGRVQWYETIVLLVMYVLYFFLMFNSHRLKSLFQNICNCCYFPIDNDPTRFPDTEVMIIGEDNPGLVITEKPIAVTSEVVVESPVENVTKAIEAGEEPPKTLEDTSSSGEEEYSLWRFPFGQSKFAKFWFLYSWPIKFVLTFTIPSPFQFRKLYPLTFLLCIIWIGLNSYFVSWMITVIGETFTIPESIMGMTFLAFGGCLPEACSMFILSRKGKGEMGISNSLGANTLAILFSIGIPWFIKAIMQKSRGEVGFIDINSAGINYIIGMLLLIVIILYLVLYVNDFQLKTRTGLILGAVYLIFVTLAILIEAGIFFDNVLPPC